MNNFFKTFLASLLAIIVSVGAFMLLGFVFIAVIMSSMMKIETTGTTIKPDTYLKLDLSIPVVESLADNPITYFDISTMKFTPNITAYDIIKSIRIAALDPNVSGIYLDMTNQMSVDMANLEEIRNELIAFRKSGKKLVSYADVYTQKSYYLSSVADSIFLCPVGDIQWKGMSSENLYFKGALDKFDINVEVFKYGKYKSAVEPYLLSGMSDESRLQMTRVLNNMWGRIVKGVAQSRNIEPEQLQLWASSLTIDSPEKALEHALVDKLIYSNDIVTKGNVVSFQKYIENNSLSEMIIGAGSKKNQIAVIYADGQIMSGGSQEGVISSESLVKKIATATKDSNVKAIVLRVNSPGGSALASDIIDREVRRAKLKKPIIVSMGAMAASGGYYISANADEIISSPFTLTGSIGVFGITFNVGESMTKNIGITFDAIKTNEYADMGSVFRPMSPGEKHYFQKGVDRVYENFVNCVSDGRSMTFQQVDSIAQGRVWTTDDAIEIGLVDNVGGLMDAITLAAEKADISDNYIVKSRVTSNDFITNMMIAMSNESVTILAKKVVDSQMPMTSEISDEIRKLELMIKGDKIQAISPFKINF